MCREEDENKDKSKPERQDRVCETERAESILRKGVTMELWQFWLGIITAILASQGLWSCVQVQLQKRGKNRSAVEKACLALLHDKIYDRAERYITRNSITLDEFDNLKYLYEPYEELGGNGTGKELFTRCSKLPMIHEVENEK